MFHRSDRLFLRPAFIEDSEAILAGICDRDVVRNLALVPWPYDIADARAFAGRAQDPRFPHFLVTLPGIGVIGSAGLGEQQGEPEIGYWIARPFWGQGYATEAAGAVLQIARAIGYSRITAGHFTDNPASGRVLRKLGFLPTGHVSRRHSLGRGCAGDLMEYALDWEADVDPAPIARAA